jgi:cytochrome c biogenesis protein CcmG, thiol:disulfide interchange protein DsbE
MAATQVPLERAQRFGSERVRTLVVMAVAAIVISLVVVLVDQPFGRGYSDVTLTGDLSGARPVVGTVAPVFRSVTVDGQPVGLDDFRGRPVWLTFGASWCSDCRAENAALQETYERYRDQGLVVLGVFINEDAQAVRDYSGRVGMTITMVADPTTTIASRYRVMGVPTHFFLTPDGVIQEVRLGGLPAESMDTLVRGILQ